MSGAVELVIGLAALAAIGAVVIGLLFRGRRAGREEFNCRCDDLAFVGEPHRHLDGLVREQQVLDSAERLMRHW